MVDENNIESLYEQGQHYFNIEAYEQAKECFASCIQLGKMQTYSLNGLANFCSKLMIARIYKMQNNVGEAIKAYIEAVFDPNNFERVGLEETKRFLAVNNQTVILNELNQILSSNDNQVMLLQAFKDLQKYYIEYPREVHIETTGRCNANCVFCPHDVLERKFTDMPDALFNKIIEDLKEIPENIKFHISPFKVNEMLLDKNIFKKISIINEELPNASIRFFSNFNAATEETPALIAQIKNLSSLCISLNSLNEKEYREMMSLDLNRTLKNVMTLFEYNKQHRILDKITLLRVGDESERDSEFEADVYNVFAAYKDQYEVLVLTRGEWIDYLERAEKKLQNNPCLRWFEVSITCTGKVSFCCMDGKCQYPIGDVNTESVLDIYNSSIIKTLRLNGSERKYVEPCRRCSYD